MDYKINSHKEKKETIFFGETSYYIGKEIGSGCCGNVYNCDDSDGNNYAIKIMHPHYNLNEELVLEWKNNLENLTLIDNKYLVKYEKAFEFENAFHLMMKKYPRTLGNMLDKKVINLQKILKPIARSLLRGVDYLHNVGIIHYNIHADNVLVDITNSDSNDKKAVKLKFLLSDYADNLLLKQDSIYKQVTYNGVLPPEYINPEKFGQLSDRTDIYLLGILLLEIYYGKRLLFSDEDVLSGKPKNYALHLPAPYSFALAKALGRHVAFRTKDAKTLWHDLNLDSRNSLIDL
ncbi:MAG: protein kinase family protein [Melioribacteraceae bacterium]|nr:protein kinase family protein [Melioribacteraceae bacterium]MCF8266289.1 protein kinase family protein [Melioribacteraceae bacterium]MCF8413376.1 protein kinase family protein [Melioribacteraceae bacterium]MCF8432507.1 protein kinase family protein [Melioribacteraceae bacterium]